MEPECAFKRGLWELKKLVSQLNRAVSRALAPTSGLVKSRL